MVAMNLNTNTYTLSATTTSSTITLLDQDKNQSSIIITNAGTVAVFLVSGQTAPTAVFPTSATVPIPGQVVAAGATITMTKNVYDGFIAGITASGTASVYISVGAGE